MTSFLITGKEREEMTREVERIIAQHGIDGLDITYASQFSEKIDAKKKATKTKITKSIGIDDIKRMQKKLYLKPVRGKQKIFIIEEAENLTTEAQNALLKVLEEPPQNTLIVLTAKNKEAFLPTILSRCSIIELNKTRIPDEQNKDEIQTFLTALDSMTVGKALTLAEIYGKNKDELTEWLEKTIIMQHTEMLEEASPSSQMNYAKRIKRMQHLLFLITTTNANTRHALEVFLLGFISDTSYKE